MSKINNKTHKTNAKRTERMQEKARNIFLDRPDVRDVCEMMQPDPDAAQVRMERGART